MVIEKSIRIARKRERTSYSKRGNRIAALLVATAVLAHHSNSAFDGDKMVVLTGTVIEWKWSNPHVWIILSSTAS